MCKSDILEEASSTAINLLCNWTLIFRGKSSGNKQASFMLIQLNEHVHKMKVQELWVC